jgi:hypothetical protein
VQGSSEQVLQLSSQREQVCPAIEGIDALDTVDRRKDASEVRRNVEQGALASVRIIEENLEEKRLFTVGEDEQRV